MGDLSDEGDERLGSDTGSACLGDEDADIGPQGIDPVCAAGDDGSAASPKLDEALVAQLSVGA
jgi:hypothetical protein